MGTNVEIAITHPRPTAARPLSAHAASINNVLVAWQEAFAGRSFELGPSIGNARAASLAFPGDDDPGHSLRELDVSLHDASLARMLTEHSRDRTRASTAIVTRLEWHNWLTSNLSPRRSSR